MQDATFLAIARADKPRGPEAKTRRNKEGTWAKKKAVKITLWPQTTH